jgi:hypothetical protein
MREPRFPLHQRWLCAFNTLCEKRLREAVNLVAYVSFFHNR